MAKKSLDTEVNLIAFISLLSVLICSLLLTAIWVQIGSMNVKQAIGGSGEAKSPPSLWAHLYPNGTVQVKLENVTRISYKLKRAKFEGLNGQIDFNALRDYLLKIRSKAPNLQAVLIQPKANTLYESIIATMDFFKSEGINDLGIAPL